MPKRRRSATVTPQSKRQKRTSDPNGLFERLPPEVRFFIWEYAMCSKYEISPEQLFYRSNKFKHLYFWHIHDPNDDYRATSRQPELAVQTFCALQRTCRLFRDDQTACLAFYRVNAFSFPSDVLLATYVAAITPARREAIRHLILPGLPCPPRQFRLPLSGSMQSYSDKGYLSILSLCKGVRVLEIMADHAGTMDPIYPTLASGPFSLAGSLLGLIPCLRKLRQIRVVNGGNKGPCKGAWRWKCILNQRSLDFHWGTYDDSALLRSRYTAEGVKSRLRRPWEKLRNNTDSVSKLGWDAESEARQLYAKVPLDILGEGRASGSDCKPCLISSRTRTQQRRPRRPGGILASPQCSVREDEIPAPAYWGFRDINLYGGDMIELLVTAHRPDQKKTRPTSPEWMDLDLVLYHVYSEASTSACAWNICRLFEYILDNLERTEQDDWRSILSLRHVREIFMDLFRDDTKCTKLASKELTTLEKRWFRLVGRQHPEAGA